MDDGTKPIKLDPIKLKVQTNMLNGVTVNAVIPIIIKEDTIEYKASAYKVREGSPVEDLLKSFRGLALMPTAMLRAWQASVKSKG